MSPGRLIWESAALNPSLGFTPTTREQFTIIKSTAPIVGTFDGLPEGASLTIGNTPFTISYHGGDGNDVVLTQVVAAAPTVTGISPIQRSGGGRHLGDNHRNRIHRCHGRRLRHEPGNGRDGGQ